MPPAPPSTSASRKPASMRDGWRETTLGEVLTRTTVTLGDADEPSILTVTEGNGLVDQLEHWGRRVASEDVSKYKVVPLNALVYNVYLLWLGAIGRNATGAIGITSPVYEVFEVAPGADPRYIEHVVTSREMLAAYAGISIGTVPRRRRTPWQAFLELSITLPPLDEQRRIVDLIAAVDAAVDAAETETDAAAALLGATLDASGRDETTAIGSLASIVSGASWGKADVRTDAGDGVTPVLTIANTKPDGSISGDPMLVHGLSARVARLTASSLIAIRTNGNHDRIGNVYRVPDEHVGAAVSAFQFVIEPNGPADSDYMYWMMRAPSFQVAVTGEASGSTGLGNIAASKLREMRVPWPIAPETRAAHASTFASLEACAQSARETAESLRTLRSNLLTVLLSGEHEIPASYDALPEEAA